MIGRVPRGIRLPVGMQAGRHVHLAADDRLDPGFSGLLVELDRAEDVAVVGHRHRRHPEFRRFLHEFPDAHRAIQQRVLGVEVEVNEGIGGHWLF